MGFNIRILAKNLARVSGASITASPAMVSATLDENNLLRRTERSRTARSASLSAIQFLLTLAAASSVNCVGFTRHNWTTAATLRARLEALGSPTLLYDNTALTAYSTTGLDTDIDDYRAAYFAGLRNSIQYFTQVNNVERVRCDIADAANPDGYIEQTQLWVGKYKTVIYDPPFGGLDLSMKDSSKQGRAVDGTLITDVGWRARSLRINLEFIADDDLATMLAIANYLGKNGECLLDVYPLGGDAKSLYHLGAFQLVDSPTFNPHQKGLHRNTMLFEET